MGEGSEIKQYRGGELSRISELQRALDRAHLRRDAAKVFCDTTNDRSLERLRKLIIVLGAVLSLPVALIVVPVVEAIAGHGFRGLFVLSIVLFFVFVVGPVLSLVDTRSGIVMARARRVARRWIRNHQGLTKSMTEDLDAWIDELQGLGPSSEYNKLCGECRDLRAQLREAAGDSQSSDRFEGAPSGARMRSATSGDVDEHRPILR